MLYAPYTLTSNCAHLIISMCTFSFNNYQYSRHINMYSSKVYTFIYV